MEDEKIARFIELEDKIRADDTDWESFFQAAEIWEELISPIWEGVSEEQRYERRRRVSMLIQGRREIMKPGPWKRLLRKITRRTER